MVPGSRISAGSRQLVRNVWVGSLLFLFAFVAALRTSDSIAGTEYVYDDLGRVVQAVNSDGSIVKYRYDANGNITYIERSNSSTLTITSFTPLAAYAGQSVTISGTGFSGVPVQNIVTLGGAAATVSSASPTTLIVTVPSDAVSGPISVTVGTDTATSADSLTILRPTIASVSPKLVTPGTLITVTGTNMNLVGGGTTFTVGGVPVTVTSLTNVKAVLIAPSTPHSGRVKVSTPYGEATSADALIIPPPAIPMADIVDSGTITSAADTSLSIGVAGKTAVLAFDATAGQFISLHVNSLVTTPANNGLSFYVFTPANTVLTSGGVQPGQLSIHLPRIPATGTYLITFAWGGVTAQFNTRLEVSSELSTAGTPIPGAILYRGQSRRYWFSAMAGQHLTINAGSVVSTPATTNVALNVVSLNGVGPGFGYMPAPAGMTFNFDIPTTEIYTATVWFDTTVTGTYQMSLVPQPTGTLIADGSTAHFTTSLPWQQGYYMFSATAGQSLGLALTNLVFTPNVRNAAIAVKSPSGSVVGANNDCIPPACNVSLQNLPMTGLYTVFVIVGAQSTMAFDLTLSQDILGTLTPNTPLDVDLTIPGQNAWISFTLGAGDKAALNGLRLSATPSNSITWFYLYNSAGVSVGAMYGYGLTSGAPAYTLNLADLALPAGDYKLLLAPDRAAVAATRLTLSPTFGAVVPTDGTANTFTTPIPQQRGYFTFPATAGQSFDFGLTFDSGRLLISLLRPDNSVHTGFWCDPFGCSARFQNLPTTGTYTIVADPYYYYAPTYSLAVSPDVTGSIAIGTPQNVTLPASGQQGRFTFSATAGQTVAIFVDSVVTTPANKWVAMWVEDANGNEVPGSRTGSNTPAIGALNLANLAAGTYTVVLRPEFGASGSMRVTVYPMVGGALAVDGTTSATYSALAPGQWAYFTFAATAGQSLGLALTDLAAFTYINVIKPDGTQLVLSANPYLYCWGPTCPVTLRDLPQTGTYQLTLMPSGQYQNSFKVTLSEDASGTLVPGTPVTVNLAATGQQGLLAFSATSGQNATVTIGSVTTQPANRWVSIAVLDAAGTQIASGSARSDSPLTLNLTNLAAGTYKVLIVPNQTETGSMQVSIQ